MKKALSLLISTSLSSYLLAAGYKIPEQSIKSVALSAANVAGANEADASYYNPANMSFMDDKNYFELSLTGVYLPKIKYRGKQIINSNPLTYYPGSANSDTKSEKFLIPHIHFVSKKFDNVRFGLSISTPAGLSKRWDNAPQSWFSKEFTLRVAEVNPNISYRLNENLSFGAGIRAVFTDGKIILNNPNVHYNLDGDIQTGYGYNLAISYKIKELTLAATFRSKVDLDEKGDAAINDIANSIIVNTTGKVSVPLPAAFNIAAALDINEKAKFEITYERTLWSDYKNLDITFDNASPYNIHKEKNWKDSNAIRVGLTYKNSNKLKTMYGFAYDETPVPSKTLGYELPDSDALLFSFGFLYEVKKDLNLGVAYLYDYKLKRTIALLDQNENGIVGTFSDGGAHLLNLSFNYRF